VVNGVPRQVLLKPYKSLVIKDDGGREIGIIRRGLGKPAIVRVADGQTLSLG